MDDIVCDFQFGRVSDAVAGHALEQPDDIALTDDIQALTYGELNRRSNRLAHHLRSLGVRSGALVGLCLPRSLDMVVGTLGILKAGAAYVPMDPAHPADRLAFMLDDAQAPVLMTSPSIAHRLPAAKRRIVDINAPEIAAEPDCLPLVEKTPAIWPMSSILQAQRHLRSGLCHLYFRLYQQAEGSGNHARRPDKSRFLALGGLFSYSRRPSFPLGGPGLRRGCLGIVALSCNRSQRSFSR